MRSSAIVMLLAAAGVGVGSRATALGGTEAPFHRGVNLTGWLQVGSARQIQFTQFTKQDFLNIKSLGCDVIRLPINLHYMTSGAPDYTVDPLFFYFLDQVVDWCEELQIHLILDNHTFDVTANTDPNVDQVLVPIWSQMAEHYKDRSTYLYYEVLNEPHGISDAQWAQIQGQVIQAIRAVDRVHTIVVTGAGWGSYNNLRNVAGYRDNNLIYSFHFYDPFMFTHQGANWTDPSMVPLAGVPFPYGAGPMPACPPELKGTWVESSLNSYKTDGTVKRVKELIDIAVKVRDDWQIRLFCGEFGVYRLNSDPNQRVYWYDVVRTYLEEKNIAWTIWDYEGGFGLFKKGTNEQFEHDLNIPMVETLGLTPPAQTPYIAAPEAAGFDLYTDYMAENMRNTSYIGHGTLDFYCEVAPADGAYCIYATGFDRYGFIGFDFRPDKDLTVLVQNGYLLDFWVRGNMPGARFDARFVDTKTTDPGDHPWRKNATIDQKIAAWDGQWHHVQIPLKNFAEGGSWDNAWFNPQGLFNWSAVDSLQIVAEYSSLVGVQFWFDDIRIVSPAGTR
jgi:endoglucanase